MTVGFHGAAFGLNRAPNSDARNLHFPGFMMGTVHGKMIVLENDDSVVIEPKF